MKILNSLNLRNSFALRVGAIGIAVAMLVPAFSEAAILYRQLEVGSTGADVSALQTFLAADATLYPQGLVTGYFGLLTKSAVSAFQARNGISVVGRVGPVTLAALNVQMNSDVDAPVIYSLSVSATNNTATLNWSTSEGASASVFYSATGISMVEASANSGVVISGSNAVANTNLSSSHSVYITGLQSNTVYSYVVYVRDGAGNESVTLPATFRTL